VLSLVELRSTKRKTKFAQSGHAVPGLDVEKQKNFRLISTQKEKVGF
jgi:hypothetical protein